MQNLKRDKKNTYEMRRFVDIHGFVKKKSLIVTVIGIFMDHGFKPIILAWKTCFCYDIQWEIYRKKNWLVPVCNMRVQKI